LSPLLQQLLVSHDRYLMMLLLPFLSLQFPAGVVIAFVAAAC
jgi:membrane protein insertase Oxa1/YidC/SpoIIIJ